MNDYNKSNKVQSEESYNVEVTLIYSNKHN
jgi:hypothetical protein